MHVYLNKNVSYMGSCLSHLHVQHLMLMTAFISHPFILSSYEQAQQHRGLHSPYRPNGSRGGHGHSYLIHHGEAREAIPGAGGHHAGGEPGDQPAARAARPDGARRPSAIPPRRWGWGLRWRRPEILNVSTYERNTHMLPSIQPTICVSIHAKPQPRHK